MQLRVPISIADEFDEHIVHSTGWLDLASGEIFDVTYANYDVEARHVPATLPDYAFTSGTLSHAGKDVEFSVQVDLFSGRYSVSANELLDIKVRAAKLFAGIRGEDLATGSVASRSVRKDVH